MSAVLFDAMGTLFELTPLRERLGDAATEAWFERILHDERGRAEHAHHARRAGLEVDDVFTTADVEEYKPAAAPYEHAVEQLGLEPQQVTLVATHGWDVLGALNARLQAVWVEREEREWPFPLHEPRRASSLVAAVELAVG